ncbi:MAG: general secretion pathway protein GspE [Gammaproteobacteria bacterium]|nr:general secretion pathway protein GspE [Gammaproteobacteria bacterium]MAY03058.1 general secretion pathway protein GspE [Gammaproteobacteria bacterium]|tara:strand:+ start:1151 stop:3457 length:2307 start_codon:yes stop_codon:yes gene_type:complete
MNMDIMEIEKRIAAAASRSEEFAKKLGEIQTQLQQAKRKKKSLQNAMKTVDEQLLKLLDTSILSVYQTVDNGKEITSCFKGGKHSEKVADLKIAVPLGTTSISGYVALSQRPVLIRNVYNKEELTDIHPRLQWESSFSESRGLRFKSMVVVPIKDEILLGVVQLINLEGDREFTRADIKQATMLAQILAREFREEFQTTQGPFDYLVQQDRISSKELKEVQHKAETHNISISKLLIEEFKIEDDEIGKSLELYYRVPYMRYNPQLSLPSKLVENISLSYLKNNLWVPVSGDVDEVIILISDPSNYQRIMEIQGILNVKNYVFRVGLPEHILKYLGQDDTDDDTDFDEVFKNLEEETGIEVLDQEEDDDEHIAANSAIIQLANKIIYEADKLGSSDVHIEPAKDRNPGIVRVRVDGECRELLTVPAESTKALIARIKVMSRLDISERRKAQDGKCKVKMKNKTLEIRVATVPTVNGESAVLRILAAGGAMPVEKLALSDANHDKLMKLSDHPHGLLLVVGPTGSGKTTTLHAVLGHINKPKKKIWTAEDPVEITQPGLQQVQVQKNVMTFADAMRAFLRADPDVILIGEMRDEETASIAVEASLTGHLVLSTLHTNSAPETITRLLDLGLDPVNFSDALLGVLAQRLMRTLCSKCKEAYKPEEKDVKHLISLYGEEQFPELGVNLESLELFRATGCAECGDTGYRGRVGVHEVLVGTTELQSMIYRKAPLEDIKKQAMQDGMRTLKQDGIAKIFQGLSDYEQLLSITSV